jgi:hypothetical protein
VGCVPVYHAIITFNPTQMPGFDLYLYFTGMAMFVPDTKSKAMHVLFPKVNHGPKHAHSVRFAFPEEGATGIPNSAVRYSFDNRSMIEVTGDETHHRVQPGSPPGKTDFTLDPVWFANITEFAQPISADLLANQQHEDLAGSFRLESGYVSRIDKFADIWWEFAESTGDIFHMTNGACWHVENVEAPFRLSVTGEAKPVEITPANGQLVVIVSHSPLAEVPSKWPDLKAEPFPRPPYRPLHFTAFHALVKEGRPNPELKVRKGAPVPDIRRTLPCIGVTALATTEQRSIHPITCVITSGDPEP